jgi:hypothetical protein
MPQLFSGVMPEDITRRMWTAMEHLMPHAVPQYQYVDSHATERLQQRTASSTSLPPATPGQNQQSTPGTQEKPLELTVVIAAPVDMSQYRTSPEEIVQIVTRNIQQDGVIRRVIVRQAGR